MDFTACLNDTSHYNINLKKASKTLISATYTGEIKKMKFLSCM